MFNLMTSSGKITPSNYINYFEELQLESKRCNIVWRTMTKKKKLGTSLLYVKIKRKIGKVNQFIKKKTLKIC